MIYDLRIPTPDQNPRLQSLVFLAFMVIVISLLEVYSPRRSERKKTQLPPGTSRLTIALRFIKVLCTCSISAMFERKQAHKIDAAASLIVGARSVPVRQG